MIRYGELNYELELAANPVCNGSVNLMGIIVSSLCIHFSSTQTEAATMSFISTVRIQLRETLHSPD